MAITLEAGVGLGANPIYAFGTEEQRQQWLPDLCAGPGARRLRPHRARGGQRRRRHPHHGRARRGDGEWVINGEKAFITNSGTPITIARHGHRPHRRRTGGRPRSARSSCPPARPGFEVQPPYRKMGWHASDTHGLTFTGCRVPEANLLGERGPRLRQFLAILDDGRIAIAALAVGVDRGLPRGSRRLRQGPQRVRQADRQLTRPSRSSAPTWR